MMKVLIPMAVYFLIVSGCKGQGRPVRYRDTVFSAVTVEPDLTYRSPPPAGERGKAYRFAMYVPGDGDARGGSSTLATGTGGAAGRPLIIWMHGGGFKFGSRKANGTRFWCTGFARRGYLCAAINYRLSRKNTLGNFKDLVKGCFDAVEDAREAVAYFKTHYKTWNIDTGRIILGGNSAGGMIALQAAYSKPNDLLKLAGGTGQPMNALGGGVAAVINFWGALFEASWLNNARVPIVSVHGGRDRIVYPGRKGEYLFGSLAIQAKADSLSIPNRVKIYDGYSHELQKHFNPFFVGRATKSRWREAGQFAADFLYSEVVTKKTPGPQKLVKSPI